ncbi:hypothetical protein, partial [Crossiella equi]|uniref:hypothetical protein n=1 Tax=Crossiella equi TaxID=130796 RepID=UPI001B8035B2
RAQAPVVRSRIGIHASASYAVAARVAERGSAPQGGPVGEEGELLPGTAEHGHLAHSLVTDG